MLSQVYSHVLNIMIELSNYLSILGVARFVFYIILAILLTKNLTKIWNISLSFAGLLLDFIIFYQLVLFNIIPYFILAILFVPRILDFLGIKKILKKQHLKFYIRYQISEDIFYFFCNIIFLYIIEYFESHNFIKYFILVYIVLQFFFYIKNRLIQLSFKKVSSNSNEHENIMLQPIDYSLVQIPVLVFLDNFFIILIDILNLAARFKKNKINYGSFDFRNREMAITFNNDSKWQLIIFLVCFTHIFTDNFSINSIFNSFIFVSFYPFFRFDSKGLSKYITTVSGEVKKMRSNIYDSLLPRIIPGFSDSFFKYQFMKKETHTYSFFFHNDKYVYVPKLGFVKQEDVIKHSMHFILIFNRKNNIPINLICENDLRLALSSPFSIIDIFESDLNTTTQFSDVKGDYSWYNYRLKFLQHLCDEKSLLQEGNLDDLLVKTDTQKLIASHQRLRKNIEQLPSFEALRINIILFEKFYTDLDNLRLKKLNGRGLFEFNTLFRQVHESSSVPSRFIDLLSMAECMARYISGFCHSINVKSGISLNPHIQFEESTISYGSCIDFLSRWCNGLSSSNSILESKIYKYLDKKFTDDETIELFISFIRILNPGVNSKYSKNPSILELHKWLVLIRNKTRGHGTPSKVDFHFYVALEKVILFLLAEFADLNIYIFYTTSFENISWSVNLSRGGYPFAVPMVDNISPETHFNPLLPLEFSAAEINFHKECISLIGPDSNTLYLKVEKDSIYEYWRCSQLFKVQDSILFILNQRNDKNQSWISFTTGRIIRPQIIDS